MGLDVYVGPLTRYYAGDWETVVEQAAREQGIPVSVIRPDGSGDPGGAEAVADPAEIAEAVLGWRALLADGLGRPLDWPEDASTPYFTDKPAWDGYGSLQVLAASVERGARKLPANAVEDWSAEKVWRKATGRKTPRFAHLYFPELWLPIYLPVPFQAEEVAGNPVVVGSSIRLLADLRTVNESTYGGSEDELAAWRAEAPDPDGPFDAAARFGLAIFLELASRSAEERLPMRLDY